MKILFDQGTPVPLRHALAEHQVETAFERQWQALQNGAPLTEAERAGFDVLITTDQNLRYQQNLAQRRIAVVVLSTTNWPRIQRNAILVSQALDAVAAGAFVEVVIP